VGKASNRREQAGAMSSRRLKLFKNCSKIRAIKIDGNCTLEEGIFKWNMHSDEGRYHMGFLIDKAWAVFLLLFALGGATLFVDVVKRLGDSAISATEKGLISLPELNRSLMPAHSAGGAPHGRGKH
jgi:hypothetical protein